MLRKTRRQILSSPEGSDFASKQGGYYERISYQLWKLFIKISLIDSESEAVLAKGLCERIGIDGRLVYQKTGLDKEITEAAMPTHKQAIQMVLDALVNPKTGAIASLSEIDAVGHRVVHGGEKFAASTLLTPEVLKTIEECNDLAPLHNPANLIGIDACKG